MAVISSPTSLNDISFAPRLTNFSQASNYSCRSFAAFVTEPDIVCSSRLSLNKSFVEDATRSRKLPQSITYVSTVTLHSSWQKFTQLHKSVDRLILSLFARLDNATNRSQQFVMTCSSTVTFGTQFVYFS